MIDRLLNIISFTTKSTIYCHFFPPSRERFQPTIHYVPFKSFFQYSRPSSISPVTYIFFFFSSYLSSPFIISLTPLILPYHTPSYLLSPIYLPPSLPTSPSPTTIYTHLSLYPSLYLHFSTLPSNTCLLASLSPTYTSSLLSLSFPLLSFLAPSIPHPACYRCWRANK